MLTTITKVISLLISDAIGWVMGDSTSRGFQYIRILRAGKSVRSSEKNPYKLMLYPGASVSLPTGSYVLISETDLLERYGSVALTLLLNGDYGYLAEIDNSEPIFIWIWDKDDPFNFMQITITDSRAEAPITEDNIDEMRLRLQQFYQEQENLESYSLELKQLSLAGWPDHSLVETMQCRDNERSSVTYKVSLQDRPFGIVFSTSCEPLKLGKYKPLVEQMACSYSRASV